MAEARGVDATADAGAGGGAATRADEERRSRAVAGLLAVAAIVAAIVAARASVLSSDASGKWQAAVATEIQRSAAVLESSRYLYQAEVPTAMLIVEASTRARELSAAAAALPGPERKALLLEASVQAAAVDRLMPASELADGSYALPSGGLDLGRRLADLRAGAPELVALDPDALGAAGDALSDRSIRLTIAGIAIAVCVLLAALARTFPRWHRRLLVGGATALVVGVVLALVVEVAA